MNSSNMLKSVYALISAAMSAEVVGVYTRAPETDDAGDDSVFPYITLMPVSAVPYDTKGSNGIDALVDVHLWTRNSTPVDDAALCDQIYAALQKSDMAITGANTIDVRFESIATFDDPDGSTKHHVLTFRVIYFDT